MAHVPEVAEPTGTFSSLMKVGQSLQFGCKEVQSDVVGPVERKVSYDPPL